MRDLYEKTNGDVQKTDRRIVATYDYTDEKGLLLHQTVRFQPKSFAQRRPDGNGGWEWSLKECPRVVIYRLPQVIEAVSDSKLVIICEGEKSCDLLNTWGIVSTCSPMGAGKWEDSFNSYFRDGRVIILPDNDVPGALHAQTVAAHLKTVAQTVQILELPDLLDHGDVYDWVQAGNTKKDLLKLINMPPRINLTDLGNARRLVKAYSSNMRWNESRGVWMVWTGKRWEDDRTLQVARWARETVAEIYAAGAASPDKDTADNLIKHAIASESRLRLVAMADLARAEPGVAVSPEEFDTDPWLLNCINGTLDLRTGKLRAHRREDMIAKMAPVTYDTDARHPLWDSLLSHVSSDDADLERYLRKAAGYSIIGETGEKRFFVLESIADGGKTTFLEGIITTLGDYGYKMPMEALMQKRDSGGSSHSEDLANLAGARFVIASESEKGRRLAIARIKELTGGDTITACRKYEHQFSFRPQFTLWLATNTLPRVDDDDTGVWNRLRRIPWTPIPEEKRDKHARVSLLNPNIAGAAILAWLVRGCLEWQVDGLGELDAVTQSTEEYRSENDPIKDFIEECCSTAPADWVKCSDLRCRYVRWCESQATHPINAKSFNQRLLDRGCRYLNSTARGGRYWQGIGLLSDQVVAGDFSGEAGWDDKG